MDRTSSRRLLVREGRVKSQIHYTARILPLGQQSNHSWRSAQQGQVLTLWRLVKVKARWGPPSLKYNGYRVIPGGKAAGVWRWPPTPSSTEVKEWVGLYLYSPTGPSWPVLGWNSPRSKSHYEWRSVSQSWRRAPIGAHDQIIVKFIDDTAPTRGGGVSGLGGREVKGLESRKGKVREARQGRSRGQDGERARAREDEQR